MSKDHADHADAELVLRVYELRREAVMRQSRDAIVARFLPRTFEELVAITKPDHPSNAAWRQVSTYWEMVYGMVKHGVVQPEYFMESNGEGLLVFVKAEPWLAQYRKEVNPLAFQNAEWVATHTDRGRKVAEIFRKRREAQLAAQAKA
jgi:hypothetical protein